MDGTVTYMLSVNGDPGSGVAVRKWFADDPPPALSRLPELLALYLYTPGVAHDPFLDDHHEFPPFSDRNTHYPVIRTRVVG